MNLRKFFDDIREVARRNKQPQQLLYASQFNCHTCRPKSAVNPLNPIRPYFMRNNWLFLTRSSSTSHCTWQRTHPVPTCTPE